LVGSGKAAGNVAVGREAAKRRDNLFLDSDLFIHSADGDTQEPHYCPNY